MRFCLRMSPAKLSTSDLTLLPTNSIFCHSGPKPLTDDKKIECWSQALRLVEMQPQEAVSQKVSQRYIVQPCFQPLQVFPLTTSHQTGETSVNRYSSNIRFTALHILEHYIRF